MDIFSIFDALKDFITDGTRIQRDALHVHVGLALFLFAALVFRGRNRFRHALAVVMVAAVAGEVMDLGGALLNGGHLHYLNSLKDLFNTLAWPLVLYFCGPRLAAFLGLSVSDRMPGSPRTSL